MTVTAALPTSVQIPGNGSATVFAAPMKCFQATDVVVGFISGVNYVLQTTGYTVTNVDVNGGFNVVFSIAPVTGTTVDIRTATPQTQTTEFANLGTYAPENTTECFDRVTREIQDLNRLTYQFGIHGPDTESALWPALPAANFRAGQYLGFDGNGLPTLTPATTGAVPLSAGVIGGFLYPVLPSEISVVNLQYPYYDIRRFGAVSGLGDCTPAIQNALLSNTQAWVPAGNWRQDGQVTMNGTGLSLDAGAVITRFSAFSTATTPMYWMQGSYCSIVGTSIASQIITQNAAPSGIILNGCASMSSTTPLNADVLYNRVASLKLVGALPYGQTSGAPDVCFMQINPQLDGKAVYFAIIEDVVVNASNIGFWLQGWANANQMRNLHGFWIGNLTRALPTVAGADALFFSQGALDYNLNGLFHHFSPSTTSLRVEDYNNTGVGGSIHITSYSEISGFVCEQGNAAPTIGIPSPPAAMCIIADLNCTAFQNKWDVLDNASGGNDISPYVYQHNQINTVSGGPSFTLATVQTQLNVLQLLLVGTGKNQQFKTTGIAQGTATTIVPAGNITLYAAVEFRIVINNTDVNGGASRTDKVLINARGAFAASTVNPYASAYTNSGAAEEPNAVTYTLTSGTTPALQVSITPYSGSGHVYSAAVTLMSSS